MINPRIEIETYSKKLNLNKFQIVTTYEAYLASKNKDGFLRLLKSLNRTGIIDKIIVPFNAKKLRSNIADKVSHGKTQIMNVMGDKGFSYTLGNAHKTKDESELVIFLSVGEVAAVVMNNIMEQYPTGDYPEEPFEEENYRVKDNPLRVQIVKCPDPEKVIRNLFKNISSTTGKHPRTIYQVCLADANNLLPGEEGYDTNFKQTLESRL